MIMSTRSRMVASVVAGGIVLGTVSVLPAAAAPPEFTYTSPPSTFSPDGDGFEDEFGVTFLLAAAANVTVTVEDDSGKVVATLQNGQSTPGSPYQSFTWNGRTATGDIAADGRYVVVIDAVSTDASTQARIDTAVDTRVRGR
jgi:hypothetical protein